MKKRLFLLLLLICSTFAIHAQTVLFSEDFHTGISPSIWSNVGSASSGNPAIVKFTSRINMTNGSGGHYGSFYGTISSPTMANGYITFDSDSLDEGAGTTQGAGPAAAPQHVELTSHKIDITGYPRVRLTFYQYLANFQVTTSVAYSTDSINWQIDTINANQAVNSATAAANEKVSINIPASGQNSLYIRFIFDGEYYFWALDDISVIETPDNDLAEHFDGLSLGNVSSGLGLFYSYVPVSQLDSVRMAVQYTNTGKAAQPGTHTDLSVLHNNTLIGNTSSPAGPPLQPDSSGRFEWSYGVAPTSTGSYVLAAHIQSDSVDYNPADNADTVRFNATDSIWSINTSTVSQPYYLLRNNMGLNFRYGTLFDVTSADTVTSITTAIVGGSTGTHAGAVIKARIYPIYVTTSLSYSTAQIETYTKTLTAADLSPVNSIRPINLPIDYSSGNPVLSPGTYWACIEGVSADSNIMIATTSYCKGGFPVIEDYSSPGSLYYLSDSVAAFCNMNMGHASNLLYADFTRNPATTPVPLNTTVIFTGTSNASLSAQYDWDFTSTSSGLNWSQTGRIIRDTFQVQDTFNVCLTVTDGGLSASTCKILRTTTTAAPCTLTANFVIFNTGPHVYTAYNYTNGSNVAYHWDFGDGDSSDLPYPSHTYATAGYYTVCLKVTDTITGCTSTLCDSSRYYSKTNGADGMVTFNVVQASVGLSEVQPDAGITIYPNPASTELNIDTKGDKAKRIRVYDVSGQTVSDRADGSTHIDVSRWSSGIYFVEITTARQVSTLKFTKQ